MEKKMSVLQNSHYLSRGRIASTQSHKLNYLALKGQNRVNCG